MVRRWHHNSVFGTGPRVPLDRESRCRFRAAVLAQRRPGGLSLAAARVGEVLVGLLGPDGRLEPSHAFLAEAARVAVATVKRALAELRRLGLVSWTRRLVRRADAGWQVEQATNAYRLSLPSREAHFAPGSQQRRSLISKTAAEWRARRKAKIAQREKGPMQKTPIMPADPAAPAPQAGPTPAATQEERIRAKFRQERERGRELAAKWGLPPPVSPAQHERMMDKFHQEKSVAAAKREQWIADALKRQREREAERRRHEVS